MQPTILSFRKWDEPWKESWLFPRGQRSAPRGDRWEGFRVEFSDEKQFNCLFDAIHIIFYWSLHENRGCKTTFFLPSLLFWARCREATWSPKCSFESQKAYFLFFLLSLVFYLCFLSLATWWGVVLKGKRRRQFLPAQNKCHDCSFKMFGLDCLKSVPVSNLFPFSRKVNPWRCEE